MKPVDAATILQDIKSNQFSTWNHSKSSAERSSNSKDASNRIFDGLARIEPNYTGPKLRKSSRVFAMGSCFAREIERSLIKLGCNVTSIDRRIERPEFRDAEGRNHSGFFHRFTPVAMLQEFQQAFGEADGWDSDTLLIQSQDSVVDLNYQDIPGTNDSLESTLTRRRVAAELVREAAAADVVILTLGLIESWFHRTSKFHANKVPVQTLLRRREEFELRLLGYDDAVASLKAIHDLISRHRETPFELVVTVSPVPLSKTFTKEDLIVANMRSKSTLRAAASAFCDLVPNAHYFPSYEMVTYSNPEMAWRPDRVHVEGAMVKHIVETFISAYYEEGELRTDAA